MQQSVLDRAAALATRQCGEQPPSPEPDVAVDGSSCPFDEPPDRIENPDTFNGGTVEGDICFEVPEGDADSLVMFDGPAFYYEGEQQPFFATR